MSHKILPEPAIAPTQPFGGVGDVGGTISATGSPKRVALTGFFVLRTLVALNLGMAVSSMNMIIPWSKSMVEAAASLGSSDKSRFCTRRCYSPVLLNSARQEAIRRYFDHRLLAARIRAAVYEEFPIADQHTPDCRGSILSVAATAGAIASLLFDYGASAQSCGVLFLQMYWIK
jgi:hypothetical protein